MPVDLLSVLDQNGWVLYSGADDGDEGCGQDTQERDEGPEGQFTPFSRVGNLTNQLRLTSVRN